MLATILSKNLKIKIYRTVILTNSMEQCPWEAKSHSASQRFSAFYWTQIFISVHSGLPSVSFLSQILVHTFTPYFPKIHSNIFPSMPKSSFQVFQPKCVSHLSHVCYMPYLTRDLITLIFGKAHLLQSSSCSLLQLSATSSLLCPNILLSTLF